jgi:uncharacterized membrane protein YfhO
LPAQLSPSAQPDVIQLVDYKPNYLKYTTQTSENRVAVFSEIYYPHGWKAMVDGKETPYFRANYALRAMMVPAGQHTIEFRFDPQSLKTGQLLSLIGTILVVLAMGLYLYLWQKAEGRRQKLVTGIKD